MKYLKYLPMFAAAFLLCSCHEDDKTVARPGSELEKPILDEHSNVVIDPDNLKSEVTFTWSAVDYGYPASVSYALYAVYGDSEPYQLGESFSTSYTMTKETFNNALVNSKGLAVPEDRTSTVYFYIVAGISPQNTDYNVTSNTIGFDVTTIKSTSAPWIRRPLYLAGNFQGWAPDAKGPVLWETAENSDIYEGLVFLGKAEGTPNYLEDDLCHFKLCPNPSWQGNMGGDPNALTTEGDPAHITAEEGMYWISVTLDVAHTTGSVSMKKVDQIGVIGEAVGGWGDTDDLVLSFANMPEDPSAEDYADSYYAAMRAQTWTGVCENTLAGEFKFRLNGKWEQSWGGADLAHLDFNAGNSQNTLAGRVRFSICFRGDVDALLTDTTNPSPVFATVEQAE